MTTALQNLRELSQVLSVAATPVVIAFLALLVLAAPPQVLEIYRFFVLGTIYSTAESEHLIQRYCSIFAILLLATATYLACAILIVQFPEKLKLETKLGRRAVVVLPFAAGAAPLLGMATGFYRASIQTETGLSDREVRSRIAYEIAYKLGLTDPEPAFLASFEKTADSILGGLDFRLMIGFGGAILTSILLLIALHFARGFVARSPLAARDLVRRSLLAFCFFLLIAALIGFTLRPTEVAEAIGPIVIICLFFIFLHVGFGTLSFVSQKAQLPLTLLVLLWMALLSLLGLNNNHEVRYTSGAKSSAAAAATPLPTLKECFALWYESRPDRATGGRFASGNEKYPVYIVAAQGGGIFAAHHSAVFLSKLQHRVPEFRHHLFAISSVSGGSVGSAVYAAALDLEKVLGERLPDRPATPCEAPSSTAASLSPVLSPAAAASQFRIDNFVDDQVLGYDLLSPLIGAMAFPDFLQRFIPHAFPELDRARALEYGLEDAWDTAVDEAIIQEDREEDRREYSRDVRMRAKTYRDQHLGLLRQPYLAHWQADASTPALLINTTEVATGLRRVFSPFTFGEGEVLLFTGQVPNRASLSTAAVLSARFPWVTPAGWISDKSHGGVLRFVDGGYFESSGMATALQLYEAIIKVAGKLGIANAIDVRIIALTDDPDRASRPPGGLYELGDPIRTLLNSWSARGWLNVSDAERHLNEDGKRILLRATLKPIRHPLPLGWIISDVTRLLIRIQTGDPARCTPERRESKDGTTDRRFDADCVVADIADAIGRRQ